MVQGDELAEEGVVGWREGLDYSLGPRFDALLKAAELDLLVGLVDEDGEAVGLEVWRA